MNTFAHWIHLGFLTIALGLGSVQFPATARVGTWTFEHTVARSELIAIGEVVGIAYRDSVGGEGYLQAPHTFVTYRIDEVVRGAFKGPTLTLRLTGGYSPATGRIMLAPQAPMFRRGDRDVLFVKGNGKALCPLVGCSLGRFRVVGGEVYGDKGLAVRLSGDGRLAYGPDALDDDIISMEVPAAPGSRLDELRRRLSKDTGLSDQERQRLEEMLRVLSKTQRIGIARVGEDPTPPTAPPVRLDTFLALVRQLSDRHAVPDGPVESLSPDKPFQLKVPAAGRPVPVSRPATERTQTLEQQLLERNDGNPVLEGVQ